MIDEQSQDTTSNETTSPAPASAPAPAPADPTASEGTAPAGEGTSSAGTEAAPAPAPAPAGTGTESVTETPAPSESPAPAPTVESSAPAPSEAAAPAPAPAPIPQASTEGEQKPMTQADWDRIGRETRERHEREARELAEREALAAPTTAAPAPAAPAVATGDPDMLALQRDLNNYASQMAPGTRIAPGVGPAMQLTLYRAIMRVASIKGDKFTPLWTAVLAFAYEHRNDLWSERYLNRFISEMALPIVDIRNFEKLRNLISVTADPQSRAVAMKSIDFQSLIRFMPNPQVQQNILGFYTAV